MTAQPQPTIIPLGQPATAGPWQITITDVQVGDEAFATIKATNDGNEDPAEGTVWALVKVAATNTGAMAAVLNLTDFAATSTDGILRRPPAMEAPDPNPQATVAPGDSTEGWLPFQVSDGSDIVVWFASPFIGAGTDECWLAATAGATLPAFDEPGNPGDAGADPASPAAFGDTVRAGDFDVTFTDHIQGQAVYDIADFGLQALAISGSDLNLWHAFKVRVTNRSSRVRFFSFTAVRLADTSGEAWDNLLALTPPQPDAAREIVPGATREGWLAIEVLDYASLGLLRVQPNTLSDAPRFFRVGDGASSAPAAPDRTPPTFKEGDQVVLADGPVNLRDKPSTSGTIVATLAVDTAMTITGTAESGDGYTWYPVEVAETGATGYVVGDYLAPAGSGS